MSDLKVDFITLEDSHRAAQIPLVDFFRRLGQRSLSTTQVTGCRAAVVCTVQGSVFGFPATHGITTAICAVALVALLAPTRGRTQPSTWTYQG